MPIKDCIRTCTCKYCKKKFTMFENSAGELIYFPANTVRPCLGYYELVNHLRNAHQEIYNFYSFLTKMMKENVEECYVIMKGETA